MDKVIDGGLDGWRDELIFEGFGIIFIEDFEVLFKRWFLCCWFLFMLELVGLIVVYWMYNINIVKVYGKKYG